jgi:hypothetical protein
MQKPMNRKAKGMPRSEKQHFEAEVSRHKAKAGKATPLPKIAQAKVKKK